jgi:NADH-quinone oxidoreductase subunit L
MAWIVKNLWLIPALPVLAAGLIAVSKQPRRARSAGLAIGSMVLAFLLSLCAFAHTLQAAPGTREVFNFQWFQFGSQWLELGWVLDPLTAVMLVMVSFVSLLIFIYSVGYMAHDENFTRFFNFLALFAGAMLGVVIANSLVLFFVSWELVGLTSYLLIGFWYHKPSASAAAKKAFVTTRIGDVAFLLGIVWLYSQTGTQLLYDHGRGCMEQGALAGLVAHTTVYGLTVATAIGILIFIGAVGKSGQVPLHVWLPDAMEGPTPVSALIHAATMVAAGVFLVARVYPLMSAHPIGAAEQTPALQVVTWIGAITALFAATIAVAQNDIKRILAYSTVSQLGYMMMGLGVGGVAVGMFHLITHAFFKALLFMGSGSVIHGCHEEQDVRQMGGLRKFMPVTFLTYSIGMLALAGFPLLFSGFWSKDEILHAAHGWPVSHLPFFMGLLGALFTAFYMTRQMLLVFFGEYRGKAEPESHGHDHKHDQKHDHKHESHTPHESPAVMTVPLVILAAFAVLLGFVGTPAWPWFQEFLEGHRAECVFDKLTDPGFLKVALTSTTVVFTGLVLGWLLYSYLDRRKKADELDILEKNRPDLYTVLANKYFIDELYEATIIRFNGAFAKFCDFLDTWIWGGAVQVVSWLTLGLSWFSRAFDDFGINLGFDGGCSGVSAGGKLLSKLQDGHVQNYLRAIGLALAALVMLYIWGGGK